MPAKWLTPDSIPAVRRFFIDIPDSAEWKAIFTGALLEQAHIWRWEQFGSVTPSQAELVIWAEIDSLREAITPVTNRAIVENIQDRGIQGGSSLSQDWQMRTFNTISYQTEGFSVSLAMSGLGAVLQAGTYRIYAKALGFRVGFTTLWMIVNTANQNPQNFYGMGGYSVNTDGVQVMIDIEKIVTITAQSTIQINQYTQYAQPTNGLGISTIALMGNNTYVQMIIEQIG